MAIKVGGTTVVDDTRALANVVSVTTSGNVTASSFSGSAAGLTGFKTIGGTSILGAGDIAVPSDPFNVLPFLPSTDLSANSYKHYTTTDLVLITSSDTVYVINRATKTLVNTYTYTGLKNIDVISDSLAIAAFHTGGVSKVFKITISGNTLTRGSDSNALPANGVYISGTIQGIVACSSTVAITATTWNEDGGNTNYTSANAVDISGSTPVISNGSTPTYSGQAYQSANFGAILRLSNNHAIGFWHHSGSSGENHMNFSYSASGSAISTVRGLNGDINGSSNGTYASLTPSGKPFDRNSGFAAPYYLSSNGNFYYFYVTDYNSGGNIGVIKPTPGSAAFTQTNVQLVTGTGTFYAYQNTAIHPGYNNNEMICYIRSAGSPQYRIYYNYVHDVGSLATTLTRKLENTSVFTNTFLSAYSSGLSMPIHIDNKANTNSFTALTMYGGSATTIQPYARKFTYEPASNTITDNGAVSGLLNTDYYPSEINSVMTITYPLQKAGNSYLIAKDLIHTSSDFFATAANVIISQPVGYYSWPSASAIRVVAPNLAIGSLGTKTVILEIK